MKSDGKDTPYPLKPLDFEGEFQRGGYKHPEILPKRWKGADVMARPNKAMMKRKDTEKAILSALEQNGTTEKYLLDQVDQYMEYYDNLAMINNKLRQEFSPSLVKEKRLLTKEMRSILTFLKLKPSADDGGDEPETL